MGRRPTHLRAAPSSPGARSTSGTTPAYYILQIPSGNGFTAGGGDESKKQWFIRIAGLNESTYLECPTSSAVHQLTTSTSHPYALQNTLFGQMLPFTFGGLVQPVERDGQPDDLRVRLEREPPAPALQLPVPTN